MRLVSEVKCKLDQSVVNNKNCAQDDGAVSTH